ncbi:MAG: RNA pyrophosphohydrolase [Candidatus Competibacteraceae bacterium]|nr:RNA pyrophosphohydrolase [Candidatus Competibacteraceae bacterium]MBK7984221.1 RNA pyrophosphohydrolase [Candidatus Competibacteraceae bacterium]MBK8896191.1 RNA pyrophosphohydrolase [Candidatus Competibacteraceae bacterium]MBK8965002.1 RNA pyrophosphohydrolase [Candidatus Competibacteraceae bacterium]MBK9950283.1 RNA pyrophosphohydrolase [Candidatus Competibacteraceae bacterium]
MIDSEGYRLNVGIILCNEQGRLFWARRIGQRSWQFPQGGIQRDESPEQAMFRELAEEVGLRPEHVQVIGCTKGWLRYRLPKHLIRQSGRPPCIGQKQVWFLLRMLGKEDAVRLDLSERPEFDHWEWVDYWYPLRAVVSFKRHVYWRALRELAPLLVALYQPGMAAAAKSATALRGAAGAGRLGPLEKAASPLPAAPMAASAAGAAAGRKTGSTPAAATPKQPVILPLRRMETSQHPVITRMVISVRRLEVSGSIPVVPPLEHSASVATLDDSRSSRSTVFGPRR